MAEQQVRIDATSLTPVPTYNISNAVVKNSYVFSMAGIAGVAADNNYVTLENPVGSTKTVVILGTFISGVVTAASSVINALRGNRAGVVTGGSAVAASSIAKPVSTMPDPVGVIRTGNPTLTRAAQIFSYPAMTSAGADRAAPFAVNFAAVPGGFQLAPGESLAINSANGDTNVRWNISVLWGEV
jgi:hypothetical protein